MTCHLHLGASQTASCHLICHLFRHLLLVRSHMRPPRLLGALMAGVVCLSATAGGSYESVEIKSFRITDGTDYELVVAPLKRPESGGYVDSSMGRCEVFTVRGTYSRLHSIQFPSFVTREAHLAALAHLSEARAKGTVVNVGWMGGGFAPVQPGTPCVVHSRALHLLTERGVTSVVSFHDAI
jgi:hypothetical protein